MLDEHIALKDNVRGPFIRKAYGLFTIQILPQVISVIALVKSKEGDAVRTFFSSYDLLCLSALLTIIAIGAVVWKKSNRLPLPHKLGIPCWIVETIGLTYMVAYVAAKKMDAKIVLVAEITTVALAMIGSLLGGVLLRWT